MATFNLQNASTPDEALVAVATATGGVFPIMILVFTWVIIFFSGVQRQNKRFGYSDAPQWATMASLSCVLLGLVMTIKEGFITLQVLIIIFGVATLSAIWFFLSRGRYE